MIELVVDALAAYRLTRLVTADVITSGVRARLIESSYRRRALREHVALSDLTGQPLSSMRPSDWQDLAIGEDECAPKVATLLTCRWCAGFYCAAFVVAARRLRPGAWSVAARALALSAAGALIARVEQ